MWLRGLQVYMDRCNHFGGTGMIKIAIIGPKGSGKSTLAVHLANNFEGIRLSFAGSLRSEVALGFSLTIANQRLPQALTRQELAAMYMEQMVDPRTKETWRPVLQWWGVMRRKQDPDYWINELARRFHDFEAQYGGREHTIVTVDDCRFQNEYDWLKAHDFVFIRLADDPTKHLVEFDYHESERYWPSFIYSGNIIPWGTIEDRAAEAMSYYRIMFRKTLPW